MTNCVMKYNKNNMYSGINIYNKLDKDIQEIIDNYLIQMRREENGDFYFQDKNSPMAYRRFISDFHLHYKFNNPIMKTIFMNDDNDVALKLLIDFIIDNVYDSNSLYEGYNIEKITDLLEISTDYVITDMFKTDIHNMELFEKICKQINRIPLEVINAVIAYQNEVMGEIDISTNDSLDFAKISVWFINSYLRGEILEFEE
jgi:hypothetical protein